MRANPQKPPGQGPMAAPWALPDESPRTLPASEPPRCKGCRNSTSNARSKVMAGASGTPLSTTRVAFFSSKAQTDVNDRTRVPVPASMPLTNERTTPSSASFRCNDFRGAQVDALDDEPYCLRPFCSTCTFVRGVSCLNACLRRVPGTLQTTALPEMAPHFFGSALRGRTSSSRTIRATSFPGATLAHRFRNASTDTFRWAFLRSLPVTLSEKIHFVGVPSLYNTASATQKPSNAGNVPPFSWASWLLRRSLAFHRAFQTAQAASPPRWFAEIDEALSSSGCVVERPSRAASIIAIR
mmetsp:Transcript_21645/g.61001  ORF Transcript_21645/g.61001 Transcript_21645/m.61001 type:complete len:297 (+) Transcript_21645:323-1213(+)